MLNRKDVNVLYVMELLAGFSRGSYLGCIGWTTLVISNDVAKVGQIFILQSLTIMLAGPILGVVIDRYKRRKLVILSQSAIAVIMLALGGLLFKTHDFSILWLFAAVVAIVGARLVYQGSINGIIKAAVEDHLILQTVARVNTVHLLATAAGMAGIGIVIDRLSMGSAFVVSAGASVVLSVVAGFLAEGMIKSSTRGLAGFWFDFKAGLEIFRHRKLIQMLALLSATALPVGQLTNAILSSFIRDDLAQGSDVFGIVDAGWAIGGMLGAALLSTKIKNISNQYSEYYLAMLAGVATIVLSYSTEIFSLTIVHGFMGFFVWSCRIIIAGRVLELCEHENVGRTKVYMEVLFSISAMVMAFSPTVIKLAATALYFQYWGIFIIVSSLFLWMWRKSQNRLDQEAS